MTVLNPNTKPSKHTLLDLVGNAVFIKSFQCREWSPTYESGYYFIDSVIFHHSDQIEIGISLLHDEDRNPIAHKDDCHIDYFPLGELSIDLSTMTNLQNATRLAQSS
jgi:hypothetical protein